MECPCFHVLIKACIECIYVNSDSEVSVQMQWVGLGGGQLPSIHYLVTLCHLALSGGLHRLAPSVFGPPAMLGLGLGTVSYSDIVWKRHRDFTIAATLVLARMHC